MGISTTKLPQLVSLPDLLVASNKYLAPKVSSMGVFKKLNIFWEIPYKLEADGMIKCFYLASANYFTMGF